MRIGIDARALSSTLTGIGYYLLNILRSWEPLIQGDEIFLYASEDFPWLIRGPGWHKRVGHGPLARNGTLWFYTQGNTFVQKDQLDVFWAPWPVLIVSGRFKRAISLHDFTWRAFPETMKFSQKILFQTLGEMSLHQADAIFADSQSTLNQLDQTNLTARHVLLTYLGLDPQFFPRDPATSAQKIAQKYGTTKKYILNVGTIEPRKNLVTLLRAFKRLKEKQAVPHQLLVAGTRGWKASPIYAEHRKLGLQDSVKFLGYVDPEDLPALYSGAELFAFPSLYEGFGEPVLEAMACGCPVVTSNTSSIPEILGGCGLLCPPLSISEWEGSILRLLTDEPLRQSLSTAGIKRARNFTWGQTAKTIWTTLHSLGRNRNLSREGA